MLFYVIQKLNAKECILYDEKNGGVCCCTIYTLNQLINMGHKIVGFNGKDLYEVDLKGNARENKAPNMCEDLTKRSAVTISKGLDEKKYPRIKKIRNVEHFKIYKVKDKHNTVTYGFYTPYGNLSLLTGELIKVQDLGNYTIEEVQNVNKAVKDTLLKIRALREKSRNCAEKIKMLEEERKEINNEITKVCDNYKLGLIMENVTGNECMRMSFYDGTLNRIKAKAIIQKTDRKILYTHGLKYRKPTTYMKDITKEEAYNLISRESFLDINMTKDYIELNTYSENDMY